MPIDRAQIEPLLRTESLAAAAQARELPVAYVRNSFSRGDIANWFRNHPAVEGEPGTALDPRTVSLSDMVFDKDAPDSFSNKKLDAFLREQQVKHLVIAGVFADGCVYWTARGALIGGYKVAVVRDAIGDADEENRLDALESLAELDVRIVSSIDEIAW